MAARDPLVRATSTRLAALIRHRPPDDPEVAEAGRDLRAAQLEEHVRRVVDQMPPLSADQKARLMVLLWGGGGDARPTP
jgi:hypothetical protein